MKGPRTWISPTLLPSQGCSPSSPHAQVHQRHRNAGHGGAPVLVAARILQFGARVGDADRGLRHAPALHDPDAVAVEGADQGFRHRRAAHQRAHAARQLPAPVVRRPGPAPRRRSGSGSSRWWARPATGVGLQLHQVQQVLGVHARPGEDQLHAHHHRAVGHAPAVGVEHRRHRQHRVRAAQAPEVAQAGHQRVQDGGAVRVGDALGPAGGADV